MKFFVGTYVLCIFLLQLCSLSHGLKCSRGFMTDNSMLKGKMVSNYLCDSKETRCFRGEGEVTKPAKVKIRASGVCMTDKECAAAQTCTDLLPVVVKLIPEAAALLTSIKPEIEKCSFTCCSTDNCNNDTVAVIKEKKLNSTSSNNSASKFTKNVLTTTVLLFLLFFILM